MRLEKDKFGETNLNPVFHSTLFLYIRNDIIEGSKANRHRCRSRLFQDYFNVYR